MSVDCLILCCCLTMMLRVGAAVPIGKPEVMVVAFGSPAPVGLATLSHWTPVWELAVEDLAEKYRDTLDFSYKLVPARSCLATAEKDSDVLAKWYYDLQKPNRVLLFITPGVEVGKGN